MPGPPGRSGAHGPAHPPGGCGHGPAARGTVSQRGSATICRTRRGRTSPAAPVAPQIGPARVGQPPAVPAQLPPGRTPADFAPRRPGPATGTPKATAIVVPRSVRVRGKARERPAQAGLPVGPMPAPVRSGAPVAAAAHARAIARQPGPARFGMRRAVAAILRAALIWGFMMLVPLGTPAALAQPGPADGSTAPAFPLVVRGGEHPGFTRLTLQAEAALRWSLRPRDGTTLLLVEGTAGPVDLSRAFERIGRERVADIRSVPPPPGAENALRAIAALGRPFTTDDIRAGRAGFQPTAEEREVLDFAASIGLPQAFVAPIYRAQGYAGIACLVGSAADPSPNLRARLQFLAEHTHDRLRALSAATAAQGMGGALSPREIEILNLAQHGLHDAAIAEAAGISVRTVRFHFENARRKLAARSRSEAIAVAVARHLLPG